MNNQAVIKEAFRLIKSNTGMNKKQAIEQVLNNALYQYGVTYGHITVRTPKGVVKLFTTDNDNFNGGIKMGYGSGLYIAVTSSKLGRLADIKLS